MVASVRCPSADPEARDRVHSADGELTDPGERVKGTTKVLAWASLNDFRIDLGFLLSKAQRTG